MTKRKKDKTTIPGASLLARGEIIQVMDQGVPVKCRVLSAVLAEDGSTLAGLEVLEGENKGRKITSKLRAGKKEI